MSHDCRPNTPALALAVLLFLALTPQLAAQEPGCTDALLQGWYGAGGEGHVTNFPEPGMTTRFAFTGNMQLDGQGRVTEFRDTVNLNGEEILKRDVVEMTEGATGEYTVESDCQFDLVDPSGQSRFRGVILDGGREGWLLQTGGPLPNMMGFYRFEKITPPHGNDQLEAIKVLLDRIAAKNGLKP